MAPTSQEAMQQENTCTCGKEIPENEGFTYNERVFCKECYFKESKLGPLHDQYKKCSSCGEMVHIYTIKCPKCHTPTHETGSISVHSPIRSSVILAYGVLALIILVSGLTMPTFSDMGFLAWFSVVPGVALMLHGLLGLFFFFIPFGFTTVYRLNAFLLGFLESALGAFLILLVRF